jgi:hypothetical protein
LTAWLALVHPTLISGVLDHAQTLSVLLDCSSHPDVCAAG